MIPLSRPLLGEAEIAAVERVLRSGRLVAGPEVEAFELEFTGVVQSAHAVAVANGTLALEMALRALEIGPGAEVIVPSFTFVATANAVRMVGATPVFADIDPKSMCLGPDSLRAAITDRTVAVIAVHLYGHPAPMDELATVCGDHDILLVEDAAQALGAALAGRPVGSLATCAAFSFYPTKNITTGEGGMVTTDDPLLADRIRLLRNHGSRQRYEHSTPGTNARMTDLSAAIGRVQLEKLPGWLVRRRQNARFYDEMLGDVVETPACLPDAQHAYHQYTVRSHARAELMAALESRRVGYGLYYSTPCHRQPAFAPTRATLPHTERASREVLSIPIRPDLTEDELHRVVAAVRSGST